MRIRTAFALALLLAVGAQADHHEETYKEALSRAITKYGAINKIPVGSMNWLAKHFQRRLADVAVDLTKVKSGVGELSKKSMMPAKPAAPAPAAPAEPDVEVPEHALVDAHDLAGDYGRALEDVIEKYGSPQGVPTNSIKWLATKWGKTTSKVAVDLRRVQARHPEVVDDSMYAY